MKDLGIRLKKIRKECGLNQREFAKKIGISQSMLSGIENGTEKFSRRTQKIVCLEFSVEESWLMCGQGPIFTPPGLKVLDELTPTERELIQIYDKLIPETQKEVLDYANEKLELQELRKKIGEEASKHATTRHIPQYGSDQAMRGGDADDGTPDERAGEKAPHPIHEQERA
jgi:transcriptional regulator with XRE-family HTH domain